ncbi:hypothetical protein Pcinc_042551 [Petrolisthes cinctipes]|uniref:Uncharacterized protein n=1 Tax=Petrolisthes cinctipes TaxID=88211 RepID=A0AAE1BHJ0_PETCI|nr:hypothetical protein Pcinc_042551 [Petrolisthes cinctipes]
MLSQYRTSVRKGGATAVTLAPLEDSRSLGTLRYVPRVLSSTISGSGAPHPRSDDSNSSSEDDLNFSTMIMDGIDPLSTAAAMAESSSMTFSLVSFDTFEKGGECLPSPLPSAHGFDRPSTEDCLNTPVTTSEMPTFFVGPVEPLSDSDPPPITGRFLPTPTSSTFTPVLPLPFLPSARCPTAL